MKEVLNAWHRYQKGKSGFILLSHVIIRTFLEIPAVNIEALLLCLAFQSEIMGKLTLVSLCTLALLVEDAKNRFRVCS